MSENSENNVPNDATLTIELVPDTRKRELALKVVENINKPLDKYAVAAILESMGLRDMDAVKDFGASSIFDLAEEIYDICFRDEEIRQKVEQKLKKIELENPVKSFLKYYLRGLSFMAPILGQIGLLFLFRYSLWAYIEFTEGQATVVALGTILSFIVSGGFVQAAGREVLHYLNGQEYFHAWKSYLRLFRYQLLTVLLVAMLLMGINLIFPFFKTSMLVHSMAYFFLLAELWYALAILYLIKHYLAILILTIIGILPVWAVMNYTDWGIYVAHYAGLIFANVLTWLYAILWFKKTCKCEKKKIRIRLPNRAIMAYATSPYFVYGLLYFCFLFVDRIISWSTMETNTPATIIWFRTPYELGMDWALLSLFITIALLEFTIERFSVSIIPVQDMLEIFDMDRFLSYFKRFYRNQFVFLIVLGIVSISITYFAVLYLKRYDYIPEVRDFFSNRITFFTFYVASAGYLLMAIGLFNGLFFLTLSRLNFAIRAIGIGIFINIVVGLLLSRWLGYQYGVFGLLAGAACYALISSYYARDYFKELDYFYYSAY